MQSLLRVGIRESVTEVERLAPGTHRVAQACPRSGARAGGVERGERGPDDGRIG